MRPREGVVRRYVPGLVMETAPSYHFGPIPVTGTKALPGILVRSPLRPRRTGATALQQAVALLTGSPAKVSPISTGAAMWRHAQQLLPEFRVGLSWELDATLLLAQCRGAVSAGGLVLLQWKPLPKEKLDPFRTSQPPARWVLVAGMEGPWRLGADSDPAEALALLVLDATVSPVWGTGHNLHLTPLMSEPGALDAGDRRATKVAPEWVARTLDGGLERGRVAAAVVLQPSPVSGPSGFSTGA